MFPKCGLPHILVRQPSSFNQKYCFFNFQLKWLYLQTLSIRTCNQPLSTAWPGWRNYIEKIIREGRDSSFVNARSRLWKASHVHVIWNFFDGKRLIIYFVVNTIWMISNIYWKVRSSCWNLCLFHQKLRFYLNDEDKNLTVLQENWKEGLVIISRRMERYFWNS